MNKKPIDSSLNKWGSLMKSTALSFVLCGFIAISTAPSTALANNEKYNPFGDTDFEVLRSVAQKIDPVYGVVAYNHIQEIIPAPVLTGEIYEPQIVYNYRSGHLITVMPDKNAAGEERYSLYILHDDYSKTVLKNLHTVTPNIRIGDRVRDHQAVALLHPTDSLKIEHIAPNGKARNLFDQQLGMTYVFYNNSGEDIAYPFFDWARNTASSVGNWVSNTARNATNYVGRMVTGQTNDRDRWEEVTEGSAADAIAEREEDPLCPREVEASLVAQHEARVNYNHNLRRVTQSDPPNAQAAACFDVYQGNMAGPIAETFSGALAGIIANVFRNIGISGANPSPRNITDWANENINSRTCDTVNNTMGDIREVSIPIDALYAAIPNQERLMAVIAPDILAGSMARPASGAYQHANQPNPRFTFDFSGNGQIQSQNPRGSSQSSTINIPLPGGINIPVRITPQSPVQGGSWGR